MNQELNMMDHHNLLLKDCSKSSLKTNRIHQIKWLRIPACHHTYVFTDHIQPHSYHVDPIFVMETVPNYNQKISFKLPTKLILFYHTILSNNTYCFFNPSKWCRFITLQIGQEIISNKVFLTRRSFVKS